MFCFKFVSDHKTDCIKLYSVQLKNMYSYLNSSWKLSDIVRGPSCQQSYYNLLSFNKLIISPKAVVAGPAGRRAPDHFFGRECFPPSPFFSFRLILLFILILFNLPKFIDAIINNTRCACHQ